MHVVGFAAALDATVHVLSVVDDASLGPDVRSPITGKESEAAATDAVETIVSEAKARGLRRWSTHIEHGAPVEAMRDLRSVFSSAYSM